MDNNTIHTQRNHDDEVTISLHAMMIYLLRKWRPILCMMIVGALLGLGIALIPEKSDEQKLEEIDMRNVNSERVIVFHEYNNQYETHLQKEANSVFMRMDPNSVYTMNIGYYITASADIELICKQFNGLFTDEALWKGLSEELGGKYTIDELQQMVGYWYSVQPLGDIQITSNIQIENLPRYATYYISMTSDQTDEIKAALAYLEKNVNAFIEWCIKEHPACQIQSIDKGGLLTKSSYAADQQRDMINTRNSLLDTLDALKKNMTDEEKEIYAINYPEEEEEEEELTLGSCIKKIILFSALLVILSLGYYSVKFLTSSKLHESDELLEKFGLPVLAYYRFPSKEKGISALIERYADDGERVPNTKQFIINTLRSLDYMPVLLCGDMSKPDIAALMKELSETNDQISYCGLLQVDENAYSTAVCAKNIVMVAQLEKTSVRKIEREIEIVLGQSLPLKGAIVIK